MADPPRLAWPERFAITPVDSESLQQERKMRNIILATMCAAAIGAFSVGGASAQATGPAGQDSNKMGTGSTMSKDGMAKSGTQGMSKDGMAKDGVAKGSMSKDGMKKDSTAKDEMKK
jgi:pentapeptide MXKDX repeat protein